MLKSNVPGIEIRSDHIISDSNPYVVETKLEKPKHKRLGKARMGFFTALALSFNNLLTKKGRTILTAFAGSIGIIGIALILSLSQGFQNYIDKIQEDTLSSYPLTITSDTADMTSAILSMVTDRKENKVDGENVYERQYLTTMFSSIGTNDLKSFKQYLEDFEKDYAKDVSDIKYSYSVSPIIYTIDAKDNIAPKNYADDGDRVICRDRARLMDRISASFLELGADTADGLCLHGEGYEIHFHAMPDTAAVSVAANASDTELAHELVLSAAELIKEMEKRLD